MYLLSEKLKIVIVGWGRGGTRYMCNLLRSGNVPCTHEVVFNTKRLNNILYQQTEENDGCLMASIKTRAESSWYAVPFLDWRICSSSIIIHVIRKPLDVYSSLVSNKVMTQEANVNYLLTYLPGFKERFSKKGLIDISGKGIIVKNKEHIFYEATIFYMLRWIEKILYFKKSQRYIQHRLGKDDPLLLILKIGGNINRDIYVNKNDHHYVDVVKLGLKDVPEKYRQEFGEMIKDLDS